MSYIYVSRTHFANLTSSNIKKGVNVGGIVGALEPEKHRLYNVTAWTDNSSTNTYEYNLDFSEIDAELTNMYPALVCYNDSTAYTLTTKLNYQYYGTGSDLVRIVGAGRGYFKFQTWADTQLGFVVLFSPLSSDVCKIEDGYDVPSRNLRYTPKGIRIL